MNYSVVIVARDQPRQLLGTLLALRKHAQPDEVLLVDNASDGDLRGVAALSQLPLRRIRLTEGVSLGAAFNAGIDAAARDFVLLLHGDVLLEADPAEGFRLFANSPDLGVAGAKLFQDAPPPRRLLHAGYRIAPGQTWATTIGRNEWDRYPATRAVDAVSDACMLLRRTDLRFDERYWFQLEDVDLCLQYRQRGYRILSLATVTAAHLEQGGFRERRTDPGWAARELATRWLHHERCCAAQDGAWPAGVRGSDVDAFFRQSETLLAG